MTSSNHNLERVRGLHPSLEHALQLALEATGAERVFLVRGRPRGDRLEPVIEAFRTRRNDGRNRPSLTLASAALERRGAFLSADSLLDRRLPIGASVRELSLRFVLTTPVQAAKTERRALVLDSRQLSSHRSESELLEIANALARLIDSLTARSKETVPSSGARSSRIVGRSVGVARMLDWAGRAASTTLPVLIRGETGAGKEAVARLIHDRSARRSRPYVSFNCAALTESLLEAELFGSVKGAYTGSDRDRRGLFEAADGGTLLLDEVGDMPHAMQAKLLRTLEEGRVRPVGAETERGVDVRVVAATHHDLTRRVREGAFRADLYHRLAVIEVEVPPLRSRLEDIPLLVESLAPRLERETGRSPGPLSRSVLERLSRHSWPGNVRELHAVIARAILRAGGDPIASRHLEIRTRDAASPGEGAGGQEGEMIRTALLNTEGSITEAAAEIGWTRQKLYRRIRALSLERLL